MVKYTQRAEKNEQKYGCGACTGSHISVHSTSEANEEMRSISESLPAEGERI